MSEKSLIQQILTYLNGLAFCHAEKTHGSVWGHVKPDITGCYIGRRFELEVKMPGKKATPIQQEALERWRRAGAWVGVVHSVDEVRQLLHDATFAHVR